MDQPKRASDRRLGDKPYYIDKLCPKCGTHLVYADLLNDPNTPEDQIWYDEFICPNCLGGIYLDVPDSFYEELSLERVKEKRSILRDLAGCGSDHREELHKFAKELDEDE